MVKKKTKKVVKKGKRKTVSGRSPSGKGKESKVKKMIKLAKAGKFKKRKKVQKKKWFFK